MNENKFNPGLQIEKLIRYGLNNNLIEGWDTLIVRNQLLNMFRLNQPYNKKIELDNNESIQEILDPLVDYAYKKDLIEKNSVTFRDLFDTKIMGELMPRQSEISNKFWNLTKEKGIKSATKWFYNLSWKSNYIRADRISKNEKWSYDTEYGELEITINLSKPEKDPDDIAKAKSMESSDYPKCALCPENAGYPGRLDHPARDNHRLIPIRLEKEQWFFQFSPYVYYNEHSIVLAKDHEDMRIDKDSFKKLFDFIEEFPHYFIGSNADLPLVGGSILNHNHFQAGNHIFPMDGAENLKKYNHKDYSDVNISRLKWPLTVIRLSSKSNSQIIDLATKILSKWRKYSDSTNNIIAKTEVNGEKKEHNTVTPIARINSNNEYELDIVLRNNRKNDEYPDGIFHPHKDLHHIKKENIGLIEVMGLAILPGRLKNELKIINEYLTGNRKYQSKEIPEEIKAHQQWLEDLFSKYGDNLNEDGAFKILEKEVGNKFKNVLEDAGVYKLNEKGKNGFERFLAQVGVE